MIEQAFEAGIDCVLGTERIESPESDEDAGSAPGAVAFADLAQRGRGGWSAKEVLSRAIVGIADRTGHRRTRRRVRKAPAH